MGFIDLDNKTNDQSNLIAQGIYEMKIVDAQSDASNSGHENMKFEFEIRKDLDKVPELAKTNAKEHGRHYFARVWTKKDPETGQDSGEFDGKDLANIADAIGLTQAQINKYIKGKEDLMKACRGKYVRIYVSLSKNTYKGETRKQNSTFTNSWHQTKFPPQGSKQAKAAAKKAEPKDPFPSDNSAEDINDDDLPF